MKDYKKDLILDMSLKQYNQDPFFNMTQKQLSQFLTEVHGVASRNIRSEELKPEAQLQRLIGQKFYNPFDVLLLQPQATEAQIDKQYRNFAKIMHPDRNKDPRAKDAFQMCERAVKALRDPQKRIVYVRVMKEGYERARHQRDTQNRKRIKSGLPSLPQDSFDAEYRLTYKKIFEELDERKKHLEKAKENSFRARAEEEERLRTMEQYRILTEDQWERTRQERVSNWRAFQKKKTLIGSKKSSCGIRVPLFKAQRPKDEGDQ